MGIFNETDSGMSLGWETVLKTKKKNMDLRNDLTI